MRKKTSVQFIEIVDDPQLRRKEKRVNEAVKRAYPDCGPIRLYRTADGRVGFELQLRISVGRRQVLDDVYRLIMRALGEKRGRRPGVRTVQTKLRLPQPVYSALKKAARDSNLTISSVVAELAQRELARLGARAETASI